RKLGSERARMWTLWMWMRGWLLDGLVAVMAWGLGWAEYVGGTGTVAVDVTNWAEDSDCSVTKDNDWGRGWLGQRRTLTWTACRLGEEDGLVNEFPFLFCGFNPRPSLRSLMIRVALAGAKRRLVK
ncbi:hypothetical protein THAOC_05684, partial [Thalassiosira oceanica]